MDPLDKVKFFLTYEEQLDRENGFNVHEVFFNFEEDQPVEDFKITVNINETLPIKAESLKAQRESNDIFEYIEQKASPTMRFLVRASYLQIYNEVISDLLKFPHI